MTKSAFTIRVPVDMKTWLETRAEANSRTVNGEILAILKDAKGGKTKTKQASKSKSQPE
jgi:hypothetical protein